MSRSFRLSMSGQPIGCDASVNEGGCGTGPPHQSAVTNHIQPNRLCRLETSPSPQICALWIGAEHQAGIGRSHHFQARRSLHERARAGGDLLS